MTTLINRKSQLKTRPVITGLKSPCSQKSQQGVLLLEVLISVLIFSLAILGLVGLQARAIQFSVDAEDRNRAALLANDLVTTMWIKQAAGSSDLTAEIAEWKEKVAAPTNGGLTDGEATIAVDGGVTKISISWATPGATSTYFTQIVVPGVSGVASEASEEEGSESTPSPSASGT